MSDVRKVQHISSKPVIYALVDETNKPLNTASRLIDLKQVNFELRTLAQDIRKGMRQMQKIVKVVDLRTGKEVVYEFAEGVFILS